MNVVYDFTGQFAVVTGGVRGIGAAASRAFLDAGASVLALYAANDAAAQTFRDALPGDRRSRFAAERVDVADALAVDACFGRLEAAGRAPDIVVNNAGIRRDAALALMPEDDWRRVLDVNLTGVFHVCKCAARLMGPARYGRIVNITSPSGREGFAGQANYAASKAGIVALTRSMSKEVARRNITVNAVSPGFIDTELIADLPEAQAAGYRDGVPLRRFGRAEEAAHAILFLCARESAYITGATLEITGGL